jgi:hypothetical protein
MIAQLELGLSDNAILRAVNDSAPIDSWSIDELNQFAELESVRDAWAQSEQLAA